jgi:hypothetical protein
MRQLLRRVCVTCHLITVQQARRARISSVGKPCLQAAATVWCIYKRQKVIVAAFPKKHYVKALGDEAVNLHVRLTSKVVRPLYPEKMSSSNHWNWIRFWMGSRTNLAIATTKKLFAPASCRTLVVHLILTELFWVKFCYKAIWISGSVFHCWYIPKNRVQTKSQFKLHKIKSVPTLLYRLQSWKIWRTEAWATADAEIGFEEDWKPLLRCLWCDEQWDCETEPWLIFSAGKDPRLWSKGTTTCKRKGT